jgi:Kef-type K+ transport system membrane component KefB
MSLSSAALLALLAVLAPLAVRLLHLPVPEVVVQLVLGVLVGPQVLGWAQPDGPVRLLSVIGLSFLLFLAGLEVEFDRLRGRVLRVTAVAYAASFGLALAAGGLLDAAGLVRSPLLTAIILSATAAGIVIPVLVDTGDADTALGRVVIAAAVLAEVVPVVLLSLLFSGQSSDPGARVTLLGAFLALVVAAVLVVVGLRGRPPQALQDTTAQVRVRAAVALLMGFAALAVAFGLEAILGAFLAGAAVALLDRDGSLTHPLFRPKLQAVGFGALIPFFFLATGMSLDVHGFLSSPTALARLPLFLAVLLVVRALPAVLYGGVLDGTGIVRAGLLQSMTLSVPVVGGSIGVELGLLAADDYVALVGAAAVTVIVLPTIATAFGRVRGLR